MNRRDCCGKYNDGNLCKNIGKVLYKNLYYCPTHVNKILNNKNEKIANCIEQLPGFHLWTIGFSNLRTEIEKNWVNKNDSQVKMCCGVNIDWPRTRRINIVSDFNRDLTIIEYQDFEDKAHQIRVDVDFNIDYGDSNLQGQFKEYFDIYIKEYLTTKYKNFYNKQKKWFKEKPFNSISDKTPEEAIIILKNLGW